MLERGVRIPAFLSCFRPSSGFGSGFEHSCSRFGLAVGACGFDSSLLGPYAPLSVCIRCLRFAFFCFVLLCVARSLCFSLAACFHVCHVLCEHAAYESPY